MASPPPQSRRQPKERISPTSGPSSRSGRSTSAEPPEVVDPIWLAKAVGVTIVAALVCGYLTLCLLFYQGQWQLVLHPLRDRPAPSLIDGTRVEVVRFDVDESAVPQLTGWWLPSAASTRHSATTVLYMPGGDGSLIDSEASLAALHALGFSVFAFDYRGYGESAAVRPNQKRMEEDANSAFQFLTVSRRIQNSRIVLVGSGIGCALAVEVASAHSDIPAVILESPEPDLIHLVLADPRTKALPVKALFHERFDILGPLAALKTPKLLLVPDSSASRTAALAAAASTPKMISTMKRSEFNRPVYREQIERFLDQYLQ